MAYILSNANRFYCGVESAYGQIPAITARSRFSAVRLTARQQLEVGERKDKTGSRTFTGTALGGRRRTDFDLKCYLSQSSVQSSIPGYGPLFQAALGGNPLVFGGGTVTSSASGGQLTFGTPHSLVENQAVSYAGEIRFVVSLPSDTQVNLNAPFSSVPPASAHLDATVTYLPATDLPSVSLFDFWSPSAAVQRVLCGAAIDKLAISINGDYHEFEFQGVAQDVVDSATFSPQSNQASFPPEPALEAFQSAPVPGNLGQAWLGGSTERFSTVTKGLITIENNLESRARDFGSAVPLSVIPGNRNVTLDLSIFEQADASTAALYQAARQRSPISMMLQLGQASGQLCGVYMNSVVPEVPEFDDSDKRLQWRFQKSRAQGIADDEIAIAFA